MIESLESAVPDQSAEANDGSKLREQSDALHALVYADPETAVAKLTALLTEWRGRMRESAEVSRSVAQLHELRAIGRRLLGDYGPGLEDAAEAHARYADLDDRAGVARALMQTGNLHWSLGRFKEALPCFEATLEIRRQIKDIRGQAAALGSIGVVLDEMGRLPDAVRYYERSLQLSRELADRMVEGRTLNNLAESCMKLHRLDEAREYCQAALRIFVDRGERSEEMNALNNLGRIAKWRREYGEAKRCFQAALKMAQSMGDRRVMVESQLFLGRLWAAPDNPEGSLELAKAQLETALAGARSLSIRAVEADIRRELAQVLERGGDHRAALECYREHATIERQVYREDADRRLQRLQVVMGLEQAKREAENARDRLEELTRLNRELDQQKQQLDVVIRGLLRLDDEKNQLLGMAAHDIKSPMGAIVALADDWLEENSAGAGAPVESGEATIQAMRGLARHSLDLVTKLLDLHAIQIGGRPLLPVELDVRELLEEVRRVYAGAAAAKEQSLAISAANSRYDPRTWADPVALRQIIENLVSNAVKYTPPGGRISIGFRARRHDLEVVVSDNGPGFTLADRRRMYAPFARLSARPTGNEESNGLGLCIVKRLCEQSGIGLVCRSRRGAGATFALRVPRTGAEETVGVPRPAAGSVGVAAADTG